MWGSIADASLVLLRSVETSTPHTGVSKTPHRLIRSIETSAPHTGVSKTPHRLIRSIETSAPHTHLPTTPTRLIRSIETSAPHTGVAKTWNEGSADLKARLTSAKTYVTAFESTAPTSMAAVTGNDSHDCKLSNADPSDDAAAIAAGGNPVKCGAANDIKYTDSPKFVDTSSRKDFYDTIALKTIGPGSVIEEVLFQTAKVEEKKVVTEIQLKMDTGGGTWVNKEKCNYIYTTTRMHSHSAVTVKKNLSAESIDNIFDTATTAQQDNSVFINYLKLLTCSDFSGDTPAPPPLVSGTCSIAEILRAEDSTDPSAEVITGTIATTTADKTDTNGTGSTTWNLCSFRVRQPVIAASACTQGCAVGKVKVNVEVSSFTPDQEYVLGFFEDKQLLGEFGGTQETTSGSKVIFIHQYEIASLTKDTSVIKLFHQ